MGTCYINFMSHTVDEMLDGWPTITSPAPLADLIHMKYVCAAHRLVSLTAVRQAGA